MESDAAAGSNVQLFPGKPGVRRIKRPVPQLPNHPITQLLNSVRSIFS